MKELKEITLAAIAVGPTCYLWNPVKELKVETHNPFHVVVLPVESGEGIESTQVHDSIELPSSSALWNPVKELKAEARFVGDEDSRLSWNPVKELKVFGLGYQYIITLRGIR